MSNKNLYWFIGFWIAFTVLNLYISQVSPEHAQRYEQSKEEQKAKEPKRQDQVLYTEVLTKIKNEQCSSVVDKEQNTFYTCKDGTKVSMINWTRGSERKGIVTREYDPSGQLILIYGHPDDVY
jgi:uncharacterized protein YdhG (YjbR/CyaY superfamily)